MDPKVFGLLGWGGGGWVAGAGGGVGGKLRPKHRRFCQGMFDVSGTGHAVTSVRALGDNAQLVCVMVFELGLRAITSGCMGLGFWVIGFRV